MVDFGLRPEADRRPLHHDLLRRRTATEWAEPSEPYVLGELTVNYVERRGSRAGRPVQLTDIKYRLLCELTANAGRVTANP